MPIFTIGASVIDADDTYLTGISDTEIITLNGSTYLLVASRAESAVSSYLLSADSAAVLQDTIRYAYLSGTYGVSDLTYTVVGGVGMILPASGYDTEFNSFEIDDFGQIAGPNPLSGSSGLLGNLSMSYALTYGDYSFTYTSAQGTGGIQAYLFNENYDFVERGNYADTTETYLGDVADMTSVYVNNNMLLLSISAHENALSAYRVNYGGRLVLRDTVLPDEGSGFSLPQALETVSVNGKTFVIMASAGSNSLTVYRLWHHGRLDEVDHLLDTTHTRFQDASVLESFTVGERSFILAAGSDDGMTLLEVLPGGQLFVHETLADDFGTTLNNISSIEVSVINGEVIAIVSSESEHGFTQITLDMSDFGAVIYGMSAADTLTGDADDNILYGRLNDDTLNGGAGDDILVDGFGSDVLTGGAGADVFMFVNDIPSETIMDFELDYDRIDLSGFNTVSHFSDLYFTLEDGTLVVHVGNDQDIIYVHAMTGELSLGDLTADHFIF